MKISFENRRVTLVATLFDLRSGWAKLSVFARDQLGIDLMAGKDAVVFVSKTRQIAKVLMADSCGITLITRKLHAGRFPHLRMAIEGDAKLPLKVRELESNLDGKEVQVERTNFYCG